MQQATQLKSSGYTLLDKGQDMWQIKSSRGVYSGSMIQVCKYAVQELGFELDELQTGVLEMEASFHDAAEFGVLKRFIFTYDTEEKNASSKLN